MEVGPPGWLGSHAARCDTHAPAHQHLSTCLVLLSQECIRRYLLRYSLGDFYKNTMLYDKVSGIVISCTLSFGENMNIELTPLSLSNKDKDNSNEVKVQTHLNLT